MEWLRKRVLGRNKIQDFWGSVPHDVIAQTEGNHMVYKVKPLDGVGLVKVVNRVDLLEDIQDDSDTEESTSADSDSSSEEEWEFVEHEVEQPEAEFLQICADTQLIEHLWQRSCTKSNGSCTHFCESGSITIQVNRDQIFSVNTSTPPNTPAKCPMGTCCNSLNLMAVLIGGQLSHRTFQTPITYPSLNTRV